MRILAALDFVLPETFADAGGQRMDSQRSVTTLAPGSEGNHVVKRLRVGPLIFIPESFNFCSVRFQVEIERVSAGLHISDKRGFGVVDR